ncbi:MAG: helix-turn-helix transcriptional regulator [Oenococcus oeni]
MANRVREPYLELKGWLAEHNVRQSELAEVLDTTSNYVNKKINGTGSDFTLLEARKLVKHFGMPGSIFFTIHVPIREQNNPDLQPA